MSTSMLVAEISQLRELAFQMHEALCCAVALDGCMPYKGLKTCNCGQQAAFFMSGEGRVYLCSACHYEFRQAAARITDDANGRFEELIGGTGSGSAGEVLRGVRGEAEPLQREEAEEVLPPPPVPGP